MPSEDLIKRTITEGPKRLHRDNMTDKQEQRSAQMVPRRMIPRDRNREQKEVVKMLLRVVLKLLHRKNLEQKHWEACIIIQDCQLRHKLRMPGYSSGRICLARMSRRINALVGDRIWCEAALFLDQFLEWRKTNGSSVCLTLR